MNYLFLKGIVLYISSIIVYTTTNMYKDNCRIITGMVTVLLII